MDEPCVGSIWSAEEGYKTLHLGWDVPFHWPLAADLKYGTILEQSRVDIPDGMKAQSCESTLNTIGIVEIPNTEHEKLALQYMKESLKGFWQVWMWERKNTCYDHCCGPNRLWTVSCQVEDVIMEENVVERVKRRSRRATVFELKTCDPLCGGSIDLPTWPWSEVLEADICCKGCQHLYRKCLAPDEMLGSVDNICAWDVTSGHPAFTPRVTNNSRFLVEVLGTWWYVSGRVLQGRFLQRKCAYFWIYIDLLKMGKARWWHRNVRGSDFVIIWLSAS